MKSYCYILLRIGREVDDIEMFWKHPHTVEESAKVLERMRKRMDTLYHIIQVGKEDERNRADMYYVRLSILFTDEVRNVNDKPRPQHLCDDS